MNFNISAVFLFIERLFSEQKKKTYDKFKKVKTDCCFLLDHCSCVGKNHCTKQGRDFVGNHRWHPARRDFVGNHPNSLDTGVERPFWISGIPQAFQHRCNSEACLPSNLPSVYLPNLQFETSYFEEMYSHLVFCSG